MIIKLAATVKSEWLRLMEKNHPNVNWKKRASSIQNREEIIRNVKKFGPYVLGAGILGAGTYAALRHKGKKK